MSSQNLGLLTQVTTSPPGEPLVNQLAGGLTFAAFIMGGIFWMSERIDDQRELREEEARRRIAISAHMMCHMWELHYPVAPPCPLEPLVDPTSVPEGWPWTIGPEGASASEVAP